MIQWTTEQRRLADLLPWDRNPRRLTNKQAEDITASLRKFGIADPVIINTDDTIIGGHQRSRMLKMMMEYGGESFVDVRVPDRTLNDDEVAELNVRLNKNTGEFDFEILANEFEMADLLEWGFEAWEFDVDDDAVESPDVPDAQPNPRKYPIDVIFTLSNYRDAWVPMALTSGLLWGLQSNTHVLSDKYAPPYDVTFIDNDYFDYKHDVHVAAVAKFKPKYATVMDVLTERQARDGGVKKWLSLAEILDHAAELEDHTDNVIVIPKYDCLDDIPDRYVLGYSVPTSHGGTPLPPEAFAGRRVHLLGGSWKSQMNHLAVLGDDVVSLDNNYINKITDFGEIIDPDGNRVGRPQDLAPWAGTINGKVVALAISFGAMGFKINELCGRPVELPSGSMPDIYTRGIE
jgi:hypothetical protein